MSFSHSSLKAFTQCAHRYHEVRILKRYPKQEGPEAAYGKRLHSAAEHYIRDAVVLEPEFRFMKPVLDVVRDMPGEKLCEHEMALTAALEPCAWDAQDAWVRGVADVLVLDRAKGTARCIDFKGLPLDTLIPVPGGYKSMRDLAVGDTVFGSNGNKCRVTHKSRTHRKACYRIKFFDGAEVVCDAEHKWVCSDGEVRETKDLQKGMHMPVANACRHPAADQPIDPYVFGFWLADGNRQRGVICKADKFMWDEVQRRGYCLGIDQDRNTTRNARTHTLLGFEAQLRSLGVIGNKHIPDCYMHGSVQQRLELLRGIMDGDGHANAKRSQAVLATTRKWYADAVAELAASLGERTHTAKYKATGFGKEYDAWMVSWRPVRHNPFLIPRKAKRMAPVVARENTAVCKNRRVVEVEPVPTVPTQCIGVDSPDNTYLCTKQYLVTHNSGGDRYPDLDQLVLMALLTFAHYPFVQSVSGALLFVTKGTWYRKKVHFSEAPRYWQQYRERVALVERARATNQWRANPSGLCRKHCEVTSCIHNGLRR